METEANQILETSLACFDQLWVAGNEEPGHLDISDDALDTNMNWVLANTLFFRSMARQDDAPTPYQLLGQAHIMVARMADVEHIDMSPEEVHAELAIWRDLARAHVNGN